MKKTMVILALMAVTIISQSCNHSDKKTKIENKQELQLMNVEKRQLGQEVQLPGVLQPYEFVQIFPKVNGFLKEIYVDRGTHVKKGQLLLKLEAPEMQQNLAAARLRFVQSQTMYETSKEKYERLMETNKTPGTISPYDLSAAKAKMNAELATMQAEEANYKAQIAMNNYLSVNAPFDGIITERNVHPGALVGTNGSNNKPMLVIQQQDKLRLIISIPEQYSSQVSNGDVKFSLNALPGEVFSGKISRSSGCLNDNYRTETVEIDVPNVAHKFKAGMYAEVLLPEKGNAKAFVVPKTAVVTTTEKKYVVAVRNEKTLWVDVTEGNEKEDSTEVFGSLQTGDKVVVNASFEIKEGQRIGGKQLAYR
ncbi:MAG: efflux RND transporter periplasmic adaptor subunit [Bacteroidetes bacterium]|nr:efflux RND transporter periplasmic adaptor subunit [Bacteroidota bacterium]